MRSFNWYVLALAAGLILSPDTLTRFGNSVGATGWFIFMSLPVAIVIHIATVQSFRVLQTTGGSPVRGIQKTLGRRNSAILLICGKLPFAVFASAGLVVSAGFVFNEVFVYWFPNFAFAFLLLAAILVLNLISRKAALATQVITIAAACIGLLILTGAGLLSLSGATNIPAAGINFDYRCLATAVIVLIGFDMALHASWNTNHTFSQMSRTIMFALIGSGVLLALWGLASMAVVPAAKLESSSIPHMTMARKALGQTGRLIMGTVVICGVTAAVNAMMLSVSTMVGQLVSTEEISDRVGYPLKARVATLLFTAGASALLMALGFVGEPVLETWIRSSLVLWLFYYIMVNISAYLAGRAAPSMANTGQASPALFLKALSIAGTALAAAGLVIFEPRPLDMLVFITAIGAAVTALVSVADLYLGRAARRVPENQTIRLNQTESNP